MNPYHLTSYELMQVILLESWLVDNGVYPVSHLFFVMNRLNTTTTYQQRTQTKRLPGLLMVLALHAVLLWLIQSGLARQAITLTQESVEALLLTDAAPPPPPVAAPKTPPLKTPLPPVIPTTTTPPVITTPTAPAISNAAPVTPSQSTAPPTPSIRTGAVIQPGASCAKPDYPSASRRLEEEGTVSLKFLIGADGRVLQAEIEKTSGFPRLDEAARNTLSKCQFRPGTIDGKAEQSWASIKYTWRLE
jgi:periplasmic protein TonB